MIDRARRYLALALALGASVLARSGSPAAAQIADLQVREAWIRWLPGNLPAGGYLTLINHGARALELTSVTSPVYAQIDLHHTIEQGTSRMLSVERIEIAPHALLSFAASGYHLMMMMPTRPVAPGDHVAATLHFAGAESQAVQFEVRKPDGSAP